MASITTAAGRSEFLSWDFSTVGPLLATVVTGIAKLATFVLAAVFQLCVMCPAAAAGIATFAAAHQLVFPDMGNTLLAEYVEGYFPIIAGVGAAVLTLVLTSKLSLEAIKLADDADKS